MLPQSLSDLVSHDFLWENPGQVANDRLDLLAAAGQRSLLPHTYTEPGQRRETRYDDHEVKQA